MSNQAYPGVPTAAIGKVGVPSFPATTDDRIDATGQRTCQACAFAVSVFRRRTVFKLLTPIVHRNYWKSVFGEKRPVNEKYAKFATTEFPGTLIHVFLPSFAKNGKAEVTKRVRGIHDEKGWYRPYCPFFCGFWRNFANKFLQDHSFPIPHHFAKFCPNPSSLRGDIIRKCPPDLWQRGFLVFNLHQTTTGINIRPGSFRPVTEPGMFSKNRVYPEFWHCNLTTSISSNKEAVLSQENRVMPQLFFSV